MTKHGLSVAERLELWSIPEPNSGCTLWFGALNEKGYGQITIDGETRRAHVVAYEHTNGPVPEGKELSHSCDLRCCINELHMTPKTHAENMGESATRKRYPDRRGASSTQAVSTEEQARYILESKEAPTYLAARFKITYNMVWRIQTRRSWKHL